MRKPVPEHVKPIIKQVSESTATQEKLNSLHQDLVANSMIDDKALAQYLLELPLQSISSQFRAFLISLHQHKKSFYSEFWTLANVQTTENKIKAQAWFYLASLEEDNFKFFRNAAELGHEGAKKIIQTKARAFFLADDYPNCANWLGLLALPPKPNPLYILEHLQIQAFSITRNQNEQMPFLEEYAKFLNLFFSKNLKGFISPNFVHSFLKALQNAVAPAKATEFHFPEPIVSCLRNSAIKLEGLKSPPTEIQLAVLLWNFPTYINQDPEKPARVRSLEICTSLAKRGNLEATKLAAQFYLSSEAIPGVTENLSEDARIALALPYLQQGAQDPSNKKTYFYNVLAGLYLTNKFPGITYKTEIERVALALPYLQNGIKLGCFESNRTMASYILNGLLPGISLSTPILERLKQAKPYAEAASKSGLPDYIKYAEEINALISQNTPKAKATMLELSENPELNSLLGEIEAKENELEDLKARLNSHEITKGRPTGRKNASQLNTSSDPNEGLIFLGAEEGKPGLDAMGAIAIVKQEQGEENPTNAEGKRSPSALFLTPRESEPEQHLGQKRSKFSGPGGE